MVCAFSGKNADDDVKLGALELKQNFKLMMVGSLEVDIEDVCNANFSNNDVIDDFDDENEEKSPSEFYNEEVIIMIYLCFYFCWLPCLFKCCGIFELHRRQLLGVSVPFDLNELDSIHAKGVLK